jgi:endonuclease/exonuclease/phosphatase (EEP) superfamily protein YafD
MTRIDPFGMAWFSRHPIMLTDTFSAAEIPNLLVNVQLPDGLLVNMVSMHTRVPGNAAAYKNIRRHFHEAAEYMQSLEDPVIVAGDLNLPSWVNEVREFKLQGQLKDSRRDILPASMQGTVNLLKVPVDHILFTADMECTAFHEILDAKDGHLGIVGTYEYVEKE